MKILDRIKKTAGLDRNVPHRDDLPFLFVEDMQVRYDGVPILDGLSFEVEHASRVAVVGPNGAGKSTLFKVIAGVLTPTSGRVRISGHKPSGHICIAYIPQRSDVDWSFPVTVADVVMMGRVGILGLLRRPKSQDWAYVHTCLDRVGMAELANRQINELSGGQQQRMFIAQALAQEAELLLMDEPLNGLDLPSQEEVFEILDQLQAQDVTVLIATHDLRLAASRFDRVMLLNQKLIGFGPPQEIFTEVRLREAYGGQLQILQTEDGAMLLENSHDND
jgi:manganese/iron transport system ATP-binding protein